MPIVPHPKTKDKTHGHEQIIMLWISTIGVGQTYPSKWIIIYIKTFDATVKKLNLLPILIIVVSLTSWGEHISTNCIGFSPERNKITVILLLLHNVPLLGLVHLRTCRGAEIIPSRCHGGGDRAEGSTERCRVQTS